MNRRTFIARSFGTASLAVTHSLWPRATLLAQNDGANGPASDWKSL